MVDKLRVEHMRFQMEYAASLTSASHSAPQFAPNSSGGLLRDNADELSWDAEWDDLVLSNQTTWRRLLLEERAKLREAKLQHSQILAHSAWLAYVKKDDGHEDDTLDNTALDESGGEHSDGFYGSDEREDEDGSGGRDIRRDTERAMQAALRACDAASKPLHATQVKDLVAHQLERAHVTGRAKEAALAYICRAVGYVHDVVEEVESAEGISTPSKNPGEEQEEQEQEAVWALRVSCDNDNDDDVAQEDLSARRQAGEQDDGDGEEREAASDVVRLSLDDWKQETQQKTSERASEIPSSSVSEGGVEFLVAANDGLLIGSPGQDDEHEHDSTNQSREAEAEEHDDEDEIETNYQEDLSQLPPPPPPMPRQQSSPAPPPQMPQNESILVRNLASPRVTVTSAKKGGDDDAHAELLAKVRDDTADLKRQLANLLELVGKKDKSSPHHNELGDDGGDEDVHAPTTPTLPPPPPPSSSQQQQQPVPDSLPSQPLGAESEKYLPGAIGETARHTMKLAEAMHPNRAQPQKQAARALFSLEEESAFQDKLRRLLDKSAIPQTAIAPISERLGLPDDGFDVHRARHDLEAMRRQWRTVNWEAGVDAASVGDAVEPGRGGRRGDNKEEEWPVTNVGDEVRRRIAAARPVVQRNIKHRLVLASKAARVEEGAAATVSRVLARMASTPAVPAPPSANEDPQQKATSTKTARAIGPAVSKEQGAEPISPNMPPSTSQPSQKGTASPPVRPRWGPPPARDTAKADDGSKPPPPPPPSWVERLYKRKPQKPKPKESTPQPTAAKRRRVMPHVVRERTTAAPKKDENNVPPPECASNPSKDEHATADAPQVQNEERQEPRVTSLASKDELSKTSQPSTLHESTTRTLSTTTSPPPATHDATTSPPPTTTREAPASAQKSTMTATPPAAQDATTSPPPTTTREAPASAQKSTMTATPPAAQDATTSPPPTTAREAPASAQDASTSPLPSARNAPSPQHAAVPPVPPTTIRNAPEPVESTIAAPATALGTNVNAGQDLQAIAPVSSLEDRILEILAISAATQGQEVNPELQEDDDDDVDDDDDDDDDDGEAEAVKTPRESIEASQLGSAHAKVQPSPPLSPAPPHAHLALPLFPAQPLRQLPPLPATPPRMLRASRDGSGLPPTPPTPSSPEPLEFENIPSAPTLAPLSSLDFDMPLASLAAPLAKATRAAAAAAAMAEAESSPAVAVASDASLESAPTTSRARAHFAFVANRDGDWLEEGDDDDDDYDTAPSDGGGGSDADRSDGGGDDDDEDDVDDE